MAKNSMGGCSLRSRGSPNTENAGDRLDKKLTDPVVLDAEHVGDRRPTAP